MSDHIHDVTKSPHYFRPSAATKREDERIRTNREKRVRSKGLATPRKPRRSDVLFDSLVQFLQKQGISIERETSPQHRGSTVCFIANEKRCLCRPLPKPFFPRGRVQGYLRAEANVFDSGIDLLLFFGKNPEEETVLYVVQNTHTGMLRFPYPHHDAHPLSGARNALHLLA